jgi:hypothetical protein
MADEDRGVGDESRFEAADLERLYSQGGLNIAAQITGEELNVVLGTTRFKPHQWYLLTENGVKKI